MTANSSVSPLRAVFTGDLFLGGTLPSFLADHGLGFDYPFEPIWSECIDADIVFANLESPLSDIGPSRKGKDFVLRAPVEAITGLKALNVSIACLGNNHIYDCGQEGLESTTALLRENHICFVGAGQNQKEADQPLTISTKGYSVTALACVDCPSAILATARRGGVIQCNRSSLLARISEVKKWSDLVVVSLHWGKEGYAYPSPAQIQLAHATIDAGADVIVGHHPHVVQGVEKYERGIIFYSLGNFFFPEFHVPNLGNLLYQWPAHSRKGLLARLELDPSGIRNVELVPVYTDTAFQVRAMAETDRSAYLAQIKEMSEKIGCPDYLRFWRTYDANQRQILQVSPFKTIWQRVKELGLRRTLSELSVARLMRTGRRLTNYARSQVSNRLRQICRRLEHDQG